MKKNKFLVEFSWVIFFILVMVFFKVCFFGFYVVPSQSMEPNLEPGDRIFANKLAYGLRIPFLPTSLLQWSFPKRGDIILFSYENEDEIYIKRVLGVPGDLISFREGVVLINGAPLNLIKLEQKPSWDEGLTTYEEANPSFFQSPHAILLSTMPTKTFFESRRFLVPPGKLFVLGDNRDHSADSRVYGYVDAKRVYGKAHFILFSTTGISLWPHFRNGRVMKSLNPSS